MNTAPNNNKKTKATYLRLATERPWIVRGLCYEGPLLRITDHISWGYRQTILFPLRFSSRTHLCSLLIITTAKYPIVQLSQTSWFHFSTGRILSWWKYGVFTCSNAVSVLKKQTNMIRPTLVFQTCKPPWFLFAFAVAPSPSFYLLNLPLWLPLC